MDTSKIEDGANLVVLGDENAARGGGICVGSAIRCECGELGVINAVTISGPGCLEFAKHAVPGDKLHLKGMGVAIAVQGPLVEVGIHPGWDAGTSDREICCEVCE